TVGVTFPSAAQRLAAQRRPQGRPLQPRVRRPRLTHLKAPSSWPHVGRSTLPAQPTPWLRHQPMSLHAAPQDDGLWSRENDGGMTIGPERFDVVGCVVYVQVSADSAFGVHEAKIPVRDSVVLKPFCGLFYGELVEVFYVQTVRD